MLKYSIKEKRKTSATRRHLFCECRIAFKKENILSLFAYEISDDFLNVNNIISSSI